MTALPLTYVEYTGDGSTTDFTFPFTYDDPSEVAAHVNGVPVSISLPSSNTARFAVAPAVDADIFIFWTSPREAAHEWASSAMVKSNDLNRTVNHLLKTALQARDQGTVARSRAVQAVADAQQAIGDAGTAHASAVAAQAAATEAAASAAAADVARIAAEAAASGGSHTHEISEVSGLTTALAGKAAADHGHSIGDVSGLSAALAGKSDTGHAHSAADITSGTLANDRLLDRLKEYGEIVTDWNDAVESGFFQAQSTAANSPTAHFYTGFVVGVSANDCTQTIWRSTGTSADTLAWRRTKESGTWGSWYPILMSRDEMDARFYTKTAVDALLAAIGGADVQTFDSSGTWTKPGSGTFAIIEGWGGGGSGARHSNATFAGGGNGGAYNRVVIPLSKLASTETVTIGAGGASRSGTNQAGADGGDSTFGAWLTAFGGLGGNTSGTKVPPSGPLSKGTPTTIGAPAFEAISNNDPITPTYNTLLDRHGGVGGHAGTAAIPSQMGGGGGGSASGSTTGGASKAAGNGGNGGATGTSGTAPAGGGGGGTSVSGAGAAGRIRVTVI